jgi:hypothetical protein
VFTPGRLLGATAGMMVRPGTNRRQTLREVKTLLGTEVHRQRLNRKPEFVTAAGHQDAGDTEVPVEVAA